MHYNIFELIEQRGERKHKGGCYCGQVRFEVVAPCQVTVFECSCEMCRKRQFRYFQVKSDRFRLVQGHGQLNTFGSHEVKHSFCITCGVQCFCIPCGDDGVRDCIGVMPHCLDPGTMRKVKVQRLSSKQSSSDTCCQPSIKPA